MDLFSCCVRTGDVKLFLKYFDVFQFVILCMDLLHPFRVSFGLLLAKFVFRKVVQVKELFIINLRLSQCLGLHDLVASN